MSSSREKLDAGRVHGRTILLIVISAALLILICILVREDLHAHHPESFTSSSAPAADDPGEALGIRAPTSGAREQVIAASSALSGREGQLVQDRAVIRGRLLRASGSPLPEIPVHLDASEDVEAGSSSPETSISATTYACTSNDDGRFEFEVRTSERLGWALSIRGSGLVPVDWEWRRLQPGQVKDVGDVTLERTGEIVGRLVDSSGKPLSGQSWTIEAEHPWLEALSGRQPYRVAQHTNPVTGDFRIVNAAPGPVGLRVSLEGTSYFDGPTVSVVPGGTRHVDIVCPFARVASSIHVVLSCPPFGLVRPESVSGVRLAAIGKFETNMSRDTRADSFVSENLEPGQYVVSVDDPRYMPWTSGPVTPGTVVKPELAGSGILELSVLGAADPALLSSASVRVQISDSAWNDVPTLVSVIRDEAAKRIIVKGLVPVRQVFIVSASGYADTYLHDVEIRANATAVASVTLSKGAAISGAVTAPGPADVDESIRVFLAREPSAEIDERRLIEDLAGVRSTAVERISNSFSFDGLPMGNYVVQATGSASVRSPRKRVRVGNADARASIELELPQMTWLQGRVLVPDGAKLDEVRLLVVPDSFPGAIDGVVSSGASRDRLAVKLELDGTYRVGPLPVGTATVLLQTPDTCLPNGFSGSATSGAPINSLGKVVLARSALNVHDFDARNVFPGYLRLSLSILGSSCSFAVVELCTVKERYLETACGAVASGTGELSLGPVMPGTYELMVRAVDNGWSWGAPTPIEVKAGTKVSAVEELFLVEGSLRIRLGESSSPIATGYAVIRPESRSPLPRITLSPGVDGGFALLMPAGRYSVSYDTGYRAAAQATRVSFDWPLPASMASTVVIPSR